MPKAKRSRKTGPTETWLVVSCGIMGDWDILEVVSSEDKAKIAADLAAKENPGDDIHIFKSMGFCIGIEPPKDIEVQWRSLAI